MVTDPSPARGIRADEQARRSGEQRATDTVQSCICHAGWPPLRLRSACCDHCVPQSAQAREIVGLSCTYSSGTVVVKPASGRSITCSATARPCAIRWASAARQAMDRHRLHQQQAVPPGMVAARGSQARQALAAERDSGGSPGNPMGAAALTLSGGGIRDRRHQRSRLDRRLRLLRLHPHDNADVLDLYNRVGWGTTVRR